MIAVHALSICSEQIGFDHFVIFYTVQICLHDFFAHGKKIANRRCY